ncbi:aminoacyl-tRNA hydrolase [Corynebacterium qintianiae]|nr:peptidyl-tRNA hydrolase [Corynebacterium qintianiae]
MDSLGAAHFALRACVDGADRQDPVDPDAVVAMQIALNLPTVEPPGREVVYEDVARAVVTLCLEPEAEWVESLARWYGGRIRKVARRSRNTAWRAVQDVPGVTVGSARAFVPCAAGEVPKVVRKLQVRGTDLPPGEWRPLADAPSPAILVNRDLGMTAGKAAAQVGHASMLLAAQRSRQWVRRWAGDGYPLGVREVSGNEFQRWVGKDGAVPVVDAGFTEVAPGSVTAVAVEY